MVFYIKFVCFIVFVTFLKVHMNKIYKVRCHFFMSYLDLGNRMVDVN